MIPVILVIACMFTFAVSANAAGKNSVQDVGNVELLNEQFGSLFEKQLEMQQKRQNVSFCLAVIGLLLGFSCVGYIFYAAPKCGMSRWWAIAPLINSVLGLIVFIVVFTRKKNGRSRKAAMVITCPTCGGKHQEGAGFCSICGTRL